MFEIDNQPPSAIVKFGKKLFNNWFLKAKTKSPGGHDNISDRPTNKDLLQYKNLVEPVCEKIAESTKENTPLSIGIFGEWGSGKTSFLMMMDDDLRKKGIYPIWFHSWKYDKEENLWAALIQKILNDTTINRPLYQVVWIKLQIWLDRIRLLRGFSEVIKKLIEYIFRFFLLALCVFLFLGSDISAFENVLNRWGWGFISTNSAFYYFLIKSILAIVALWASNPGEILKLFSFKLGIDFSKFSEQKTYKDHIAFVDTFTNEFQRIIDKITFHGPLVVFIDDLDRCLPEKAVQILEAMKLFLEIRNCVFVLAVDQSIIEKAIILRYKDLIDISKKLDDNNLDIISFGNNYFEKLVQLPINLPRLTEEDLEEMILNLYPGKDAENFAKVFSIGLENNPRKVKRAIQSFLFLRHLAKKQVSDKKIKTSLLAKIVVLQNRYPPLYEEIGGTLQLLSHMEGYFRSKINEQEVYLREIVDATLREKVSLYATRYPSLGGILMQQANIDDTFSNENISNYTNLVRSLSEIKPLSPSSKSMEGDSLIVREYLRRMIDETPLIREDFMTTNFVAFTSESEDEGQIQSLNIEQFLKQNTRAVILGSPGIGKTYFLKYLQVSNATSILKQDNSQVNLIGISKGLFPIWLKASLLSSLNESTMIEIMRGYFTLQGIQDIDLVMKLVILYLEKGQCLLMFDALDEIRAERRHLVEEKINEFSAMYPGNKYLITMRTSSFERKNHLPAFTPYALQSWNLDQIHQFIAKKIPALTQEQFNSFLKENPDIKTLIINPLFLNMLVLTYHRYGKFPTNIDASVGLFVENLLLEMSKSDLAISLDRLQEFFIDIAILMKEKNVAMIDKSEVIAVLEKISGKSTSYALQILNDVVGHSGLYLEYEYGKYSFVSILIQEYFLNTRQPR